MQIGEGVKSNRTGLLFGFDPTKSVINDVYTPCTWARSIASRGGKLCRGAQIGASGSRVEREPEKSRGGTIGG